MVQKFRHIGWVRIKYSSLSNVFYKKMKRVLVAWPVRLRTLILIRNHLDTAKARGFPSAHIKIG